MHQKNEEGLSPASAGKTKQELDQMNNEELMALYKQTGDNDIKWALAMRFQEPLRRIAMRTCGAYGGMNQLEDVIHEGLLNDRGQQLIAKHVKALTPTQLVDLEVARGWHVG